MTALNATALDDNLVSLRLVTIREAAALLALSESKMFELLAGGELPRVRIGGATRIRVSAILAFIARAENAG